MNKYLYAFILLLFQLVSFTINAHTLHVSKTGIIKSVSIAISIAKNDDTIEIEPGEYKESGIALHKRLYIEGNGSPVIDGMNKGTIITITSDFVTLKGLTLKNTGESAVDDWAAIKIINSRYCFIENNKIDNACFGIFLSNCSHCSIYNNTLKGSAIDEATSGGGLHLLHCDNCNLVANTVHNHRDGIYFEFVSYTLIDYNVSENNIRYGLHFMFSDHDIYMHNTFKNNLAGVAVMYSKFISMKYNSFDNNWGAASYGLLVKEIKGGVIEYNTFKGNTTGIELEGTDRAKILMNVFRDNGWALKIVSDCFDDTITLNNFYNNSFDVATLGTGHCTFNNNYWDDYQGYDLNNDGIGDIPFQPVSFFSVITQESPESMILLNSFIIQILNKAERLVPVFTPVTEKDNAPLMNPVSINNYVP